MEGDGLFGKVQGSQVDKQRHEYYHLLSAKLSGRVRSERKHSRKIQTLSTWPDIECP